MAANLDTLLIHKVMGFGKKVANVDALQDPEAPRNSLTSLQGRLAEQYKTTTCLRTYDVAHKSQVAEVTTNSRLKVLRLTNVRGLKRLAPAPRKNVDSGVARDFVDVNGIDQAFAPQRNNLSAIVRE